MSIERFTDKDVHGNPDGARPDDYGWLVRFEDWLTDHENHKAKISQYKEALKELTALVRGECPGLLNEDSGGNGELSATIDGLLGDEIRSGDTGDPDPVDIYTMSDNDLEKALLSCHQPRWRVLAENEMRRRMASRPEAP